MKFSYNWICELVEGLDLAPRDLERLITMKTAECEGIEEMGAPVHDHIVEIDNKSITHRPDLWGHLGMAREVAAISNNPLRDPVKMDLLPKGAAPIRVAIQNLELCPRYSALVFENVTVGPSPLWLQHRLESVGLNSIDNIVDFTNLVMVELSQPMHAFDRDTLSGDTIFIRPASAGERIAALNDEDYALDGSNLVIADARGPIAIAGVIGGKETAIGAGTRSIVLESACFQAASVRRTSAKLKLRTDASMRFEKSQDPANTVRALARAVELLAELSPGIRLVGGLADERAERPAPAPIALPMDWLRRKLGLLVTPYQVRDILTRLEFKVTGSDETLQVTPPSWRATKDIAIKDDLVEEVGRMIGYDAIAPCAPLIAAGVPPSNPGRTFQRAIRAAMTAQGFTEVYNYSFVSEEDARALGFNPADHVAAANPIASDQTLLRLSLLPGIRKNLIENCKRFDSFRIFEIGREIQKQPAGLPVEIPHLAAAIYAKDDGEAGLFEAKRIAECLMPGAELVPSPARSYEHPARAAELRWRGRIAGRISELHPALIEGRAATLYVNLETVLALSNVEKRYTPPRRYPSSAFDLSVIAGLRELSGDLLKKLVSFVPEGMLETAEFVRQYAGPQVAEGSKSVSFRLTVGSADRTLSSEEVAAIRNGVIDGMRGLGYDLRL